MLPAAPKVRRAEPRNQTDAVTPERVEVGYQRRSRLTAVAPGSGDLHLVPALEARLAARQDQVDATVEAAPLALDQVAEHLLHAPFPGGRMRSEDVLCQRRDLGADRRRDALQQPRGVAGRERPSVGGHRPALRASSRAITTRWIWFVPS